MRTSEVVVGTGVPLSVMRPMAKVASGVTEMVAEAPSFTMGVVVVAEPPTEVAIVIK